MYKLVITIVMGAALLLAAQPGNDPEKQLQAAINKEVVEGDLNGAINLYKEIVADNGGNRAVTAQSLLRLGQCYEKLGQDEARKAYQRILDEYPQQLEEVKLARERLSVLKKNADAGKELAFVTRQVWNSPEMDYEGAPSPDGRYLSFVDWETGDLAVRDLETGTNRRLTNKGPWEKSDEFAEFSRWSPDGKRIAYDWYDGKCCVDLHVIALDGGKPRVLVNYDDDSWMQTYDWSPDGTQILTFLEKKTGTRQIVLVSAANGATKVIKTFIGRGDWPQTMRFSRDGQYIAYDWQQEEGSREHDILLISADGKREFPLVKHPADDRLLGWPPDGNGVIFSSNRTGSVDMWHLPVSGGKARGMPELLKGGLEQIVPMGFTQSGAFYYAQAVGMLDVYVARMDPKSGKAQELPEKEIKQFEGANSWPDYSFDGKFLAYATTRTRSSRQDAYRPNILCIRSLENGKEREFITKFKRLAGTRWAPDGQSIYIGAYDSQGMGIYQVNAQNGEFTGVVRTELPATLHCHEISPDGNTLVYERRESPKQSYRILSRNLTTGEEKELKQTEDRAMFSISPDGRWLAFINRNKNKNLSVMPLSGGEPKVMLRFEEERSYWSALEWSADGRYIFFPRIHQTNDQRQFALWRIPAEGGEPQQLNLVMLGFQQFSTHPDGQHLVFDSNGFKEQSSAIWVMENFLPTQ